MKYIDFIKITQTIVCTVSFVCLASVQASQLHLQLENDAAFAEDGNYSNGMILGWESHAIKQNSKSDFDLRYWQQLFFFSESQAHQAWGLKVSQRMWTPAKVKIAEIQPYDRPYAGFLEFSQHSALYSRNIAQKSWLSIGIIGPASGTEQLQDSVHKMIGANKPKGWQYQIENQATIEFAYEIDYLLFRNSVPLNRELEFSTFNHNTLGNFRSEVNVGFSVRWGTNLAQTFGRLSSQFGHVGNLISETAPQSLVFFTRFQAGHRFNDLTFDGTLPYQSEVEFKPNQVRSSTGVCYYFSEAAITWSFNFYSKEYHEDKDNWHGYGLLQFSWLM